MNSKTIICICMLVACVAVSETRSVKKTRRSAENKSSCRLVELKLQKQLDLKRFQGKWYGTFKTSMGDSLLSYFTEIYDPRIIFNLKTDGSYDIKAFGSKFYGGWCPNGKGHAKMPMLTEPEKMTMYFDTRIGRQIGMKPSWILKTDYTKKSATEASENAYISYAIIYSCWKANSDGTCDSDSTYVGVIQRKPKALDPEKRTEIDNALKQACVDPRRLSAVSHYGYCPNRDGDL